MSASDQTIQITLQLPMKVYRRVAQAAADEKQRPEDLLRQLVAKGLDAHINVRQQLERVSKRYRVRLAKRQKIAQSSDEILQDLNQIRGQVADELNP